jgi:hypothetical protein
VRRTKQRRCVAALGLEALEKPKLCKVMRYESRKGERRLWTNRGAAPIVYASQEFSSSLCLADLLSPSLFMSHDSSHSNDCDLAVRRASAITKATLKIAMTTRGRRLNIILASGIVYRTASVGLVPFSWTRSPGRTARRSAEMRWSAHPTETLPYRGDSGDKTRGSDKPPPDSSGLNFKERYNHLWCSAAGPR